VNVLVVGGGGREHALIWKLAQSPRITRLFCAPGNAGVEALARCVPLPVDDIGALKAFAEAERVDLTVVGPEGPLGLGIADAFRKAQLRIFGPTRAAARIETSKAFSKELMTRHRIPTAAASTFESLAPALAHLERQPLPIVVKADGLAQGKGVVVAKTREEAAEACVAMMEKNVFGEAGNRIVIEEFLDGQEVTVMAFTDGHTVVPMVAAQDHKRVGDADTGPNTGGMGAYAPAPVATPAFMSAVTSTVLRPIVEGLSRLGSPFQGVLYAGLMIVGGRPYVLEFNARFGDPETQVVVPLLRTDLLDILEAVAEHRLDQVEVAWHPDSAVCVVLTSGGYPGGYDSGKSIHGLEATDESVMVFHAGTRRRGDEVVTAGGRVLGVTATGPDLRMARERAYAAVNKLTFDACHFRSDIAQRIGAAST
jgi:phosphoribosylamine--glycine ligase